MMNPAYLSPLLTRYRSHASDTIDPLGKLLERHRQYRQSLLIDLVAVATGLTLAAPDTLDPLALQAIHDTNPTFDPNRLGDYTDAELMGVVNSAKGKYFEYLVVDQLNAGATVGDVTLPDGYYAQLADSMTQPGWDIRIVDANGQTADLLQLKATESIGYLQATLERYPDIVILTTHEVAEGLPNNRLVLDSDLSEADLEQTINATLDNLQSGWLDQFWETFNPLIPLLVIAATQGYQIVVNRQRIASSVEVAKARAARSLVAGGVGAMVKVVTDSFLVAIPATILTGWLFDRAQTIDELVAAMHKSNRFMEHRTQFYRQLATRGA
jgi:hypothetical protein